MNLTQKQVINMTRLVMTLVTVIIVTVLAASTFAYGHNWGRGHGGMPYDGCEPAVLSQLNLTVKQATEISVFRDTFLKDTKQLWDMLLSKRDDLRVLWLRQSPDQEKILAMQKEISVLRNQIKEKRDVYRLNVYNVLTPEQKEKLKSYGPGRGFGHGMRGN
jgi:Spy/CpxP family protein refolding chaperone